MDFYVYIHRRKSDGKIFYVGKGRVKNRRAYQKGVHRSDYWHKVVAKHGRTVEIYSYWTTNEEACAEEVKLIAFFKSVGCVLVNATEGGEGTVGRKQPARVRKILSDYAKQRTGKNSQRGIPVIVEFESGEKLTFITGREASKYLGVKPCTLCDWMHGRYLPSKDRKIKTVYKGKQ